MQMNGYADQAIASTADAFLDSLVELAGADEPRISAQSYIAVDMETGQVLTEKNAREPRSPASLTKLMTALVAVDLYTLDETVTVYVPSLPNDAARIKLFTGEKLTARDLIAASLIASANDAAYALAYGKPEGLDRFVELMNAKAVTIGLSQTRYTNPVGFDGVGHETTAADIALVSKEVLNNEFLRSLVATRSQTIYSTDRLNSHFLYSTNQLLGTDGVTGIKTGSTSLAGETLSLLVELDGHEVLIVLMGSRDRFADARAMMQWLKVERSWHTVGQSWCQPDWQYLLLTAQVETKECVDYSKTIILPQF